MSAVREVIANPILNSPFDEPTRHFHFSEEGITNEVQAGRRTSAYFVPISPPKMKNKQQLALPGGDRERQRLQENEFINHVRERVALWRKGGYREVTRTTARLLAYWSDPSRERRLFFCQIETLETVIYITEVARKFVDTFIIARSAAPSTSPPPAKSPSKSSTTTATRC